MTVAHGLRITAAALVAAVCGMVAAGWMPRGPLTGGKALWSVGVSAVVGLAAGRAAVRGGRCWSPAAFVVALELTRAGVRGPSVDAPHPSPFGFVALVTGRGVHGVLAVFPLVPGAAYGSGLARRVITRAGRRAGGGDGGGARGPSRRAG